MVNHESAHLSVHQGYGERKKSATSFSSPGFASSGTYSANFVITLPAWTGAIRYEDLHHTFRTPRHYPLSLASLSQTNFVKGSALGGLSNRGRS